VEWNSNARRAFEEPSFFVKILGEELSIPRTDDIKRKIIFHYLQTFFGWTICALVRTRWFREKQATVRMRAQQRSCAALWLPTGKLSFVQAKPRGKLFTRKKLKKLIVAAATFSVNAKISTQNSVLPPVVANRILRMNVSTAGRTGCSVSEMKRPSDYPRLNLTYFYNSCVT